MLKWIVLLAIVALVAAALGYRGVARGAGTLAGILTALLIVAVAVVLLLFAWAGGGWL